jgi:5'-nucleotidase
MIIAIDVDGVVVDLVTQVLAIYNARYVDDIPVEKITDWDIDQFVKPECGMKIYEIFEAPGIYDFVEPFPGALNTINWLREVGHRVVFVTTPAPGTEGVKQKWLIQHGFLPLPSYGYSSDYVEARDKSLIAADLLLDDNYDNVLKFPGIGVLMEQPWNRNKPYGWRVKNWHDFGKKFESFRSLWQDRKEQK